MRNLIRSPLTWLVVAEVVVVGALIVVAWNVIGAVARPAMASPSLGLPAATDDSSPPPDFPETGTPGLRGPLPGLNLNSAFWRQRLQQLNRDQAGFQQLEWRVVHAAMDAIRRYVETVVLPSLRQAERAGGGVVP
jgi:hypothetical protein